MWSCAVSTVFAALAREVPGIELGASVVVQPRHPRMLAAQAQTVEAASSGRLALGLGVSHPGLPLDRTRALVKRHSVHRTRMAPPRTSRDPDLVPDSYRTIIK
jgi:alkanesulfonate monooxygenase SsuD/methylene tetrahydromethanopterin reductase-like flavin-dependent oxidoreductase (luciferase family)